MSKFISMETKQEIAKAYSESNMTTTKIGEKFGIRHSTVSKIAREMGCKPRVIKGKHKKFKKCGHCGKTVNLANVYYCPYCGHKLMTEREEIISSLKIIMSDVLLLPESSRDKHRRAILTTIQYLERLGEEDLNRKEKSRLLNIPEGETKNE